MTLRNAFESVATESTLKSLLHALRELVARRPPALDAADRIRIISDANSAMYVSQYWGAFNTYPAWYGSGAPASMDAREQQEELSLVNFNQVRQQRWVL